MFKRFARSCSIAVVMGATVLSLVQAAPAGSQKSTMPTAQPTEFTGTVNAVDKKGMAMIQTDDGQEHKIKNHGWQAGDKVSCAKRGKTMTCAKIS